MGTTSSLSVWFLTPHFLIDTQPKVTFICVQLSSLWWAELGSHYTWFYGVLWTFHVYGDSWTLPERRCWAYSRTHCTSWPSKNRNVWSGKFAALPFTWQLYFSKCYSLGHTNRMQSQNFPAKLKTSDAIRVPYLILVVNFLQWATEKISYRRLTPYRLGAPVLRLLWSSSHTWQTIQQLLLPEAHASLWFILKRPIYVLQGWLYMAAFGDTKVRKWICEQEGHLEFLTVGNHKHCKYL